MTDDLIPAQPSDIAERDGGDIESLTRTSEFLPQLRIYGGESDIVKEGKFPIGHFGLYFSADKIVDLGEQFDSLVVDWRPRACIVAGDAPINFYGRYSEETQAWEYSEAFVKTKDSAMSKTKGYLVGLEYLLWIPSIERYALFLMGSPTLRRESANVKALIRNAATLKIKLIKTVKFTWHGCVAFACTTPFNVPDMDKVQLEINKFREPQDSQVEIDKDSGGEGRAR